MTLSTRAIRSAQALETDEAWLILLEIDHATLAQPIRVVNNNEDIISNGQTFLAYPFEIVLANDDGEKLPQVSLSIDNVDQTIIRAIRGMGTPPTVDIMLILSDFPDSVEIQISDMTLRGVSWTAQSVTGILYIEDILNKRFPDESINLASGYHGLFR